MSGVLATLDTGLSVASALETLAFGAAGPVVLGGFEFLTFEVPAEITLPVKQQTALHILIGGDRVLDALGPNYGDIGWSGVFLGPGAEYRAQSLKALVDAAQPVALTWGTFAFTVFPHAAPMKFGYAQIPYSVHCTILRDESAAQAAAGPDLNGTTLNDIGSAIAMGGTQLSATLATAQTTLENLAPILPGTTGVLSALTAVQTAQGVTNTLTGGSTSLIAGVASRAAALPTPIASMADLATAAAQTGTLAQGVAAVGFLGRMAANLTANL